MDRLPTAAAFDCRGPRQHYSLGAMGWFVELVLSAPCSQRAAARIVQWLSRLRPGQTEAPGANTGRNWLFRLGHYELTCPKEVADDWVWLVDHTVQLGLHKGLVVVGLRLSAWEDQPQPLTHQDVRLLHLEPMEHSDGRSVHQELEKVVAATGVPRQIVSDGGLDLKKGIELFRQAHPGAAHTYDITHKVALLLKKELESDSRWEEFVSQSSLARRGLTLTESGFLVPPALKSKARYMNVDCLVAWGRKVLAYLEQLDDSAKASRVEARLGWLRRYQPRLSEWSALLAVAQAAEHYVRHQGWHGAAQKELRAALKPLATGVASRRLKNRLLEFAAEQAAMAAPGERLVGSTEVLESLIGKYKRLQAMHSASGMTRTILALGAMVGRRCLDSLAQALANITNHEVSAWCQDHLGITLQARRQRAFATEQTPHPIGPRSKPCF